MKHAHEIIIRQDDINVIEGKSNNLQASAGQFSLAASRIREDQLIQQYRMYALLFFVIVIVVLLSTLWSRPGSLIIALAVVGAVAVLVFLLIHRRKQSTIRLANTIGASRDIESAQPNE